MKIANILPIFIITIFYTAASSIGIKLWETCEELARKESSKTALQFYRNSTTIAWTFVVASIMNAVFKEDYSLYVTLILGIIGSVISGATLHYMMDEKCKDNFKKSDKDYIIFSLVAHIIVLLVSGYFVRKGMKRAY